MSEDRLDKALQEMKAEDVDGTVLDAARARVWQKLTDVTGANCAEFRPDFQAYVSGQLAGSRRVLMDDHLSRCQGCRTAIAEFKGERRVIQMPQRSRVAVRLVKWGSLAAAAALFLGVLYVARGSIDAMMGPGGPRATVVSVNGGVYRLLGGALQAGASISEKEHLRTGPGAHAVLRLADGSMVDVNEGTELFVTAAWSGRAIHLQRGDVIVRAAKQRRGHLRVLTRDSEASVKGTVFAVSAGLGGSVVSVIEGSVAVTQPGREVLLKPGEQAATNPALAGSIEDAVAWSPSAEEYLAILGSLAKIERELAAHPAEALRTQPALLAHLPASAFVYGAIPNIGGTLGRALVAAEQQSVENPAFGMWWNSQTGRELREMVDRLQSLSSLLGDEIVFSASAAGLGDPVPVVMARVLPGKRGELSGALESLFAAEGETTRPYSVTDELVVVSNLQSNLTWVLGHLGQGAASPFAAAIGERYRRGVGWLVGIDAPVVIKASAEDDAPPIDFARMMGVKYLFLEQRAPSGGEENELTLAFQERRVGMASWLADSGSGGAAEYLPADALLAGYASTREPLQLFQELTGLVTKEEPSFAGHLALANEKLGDGFIEELTRAMGTEGAFALTGFSVNGPTWVAAALVNNPQVVDSSLQKLVATFNAELAPGNQNERIDFRQESAGGRTWSTLKPASFPFGVTWTYDGGYMVAASDRAAVERAIANRNGGSSLVWSPAFVGQLPSSAGIHPAAFGWVNTKGAFEVFSALSPNPTLTKLLAERDPVLVVFNGTTERIHAASRTRISGLILDVMLLESLTRTRQATGAATPTVSQ